MLTSFNSIAYLIYLPVVVIVTWFVAHTLFKNSRVFMLDIFHGKAEIAMATNRLFETGFYLLNLGFSLWIMTISYKLAGSQEMLEVLSTKIGGFLIYLGIMLFFNLYLFFRGRRISKSKERLAAVTNAPFPKD
ncbi:hypothetical protein [Chitinophaga sp. Cy-1792]|uniref:hypothetical protein n=1 Tax=Chitinophaga sp. Cy-1792 TaxID=2608339 RepID=UPI00141EBBDD|nr:hypothetical protein [Chitinophaga sp. Cy-1792]NIG55167.1 hypothetical protein [Chitinophaga sp. Cy-1792]